MKGRRNKSLDRSQYMDAKASDWDTEGYTSGYSTGGGGYDRIKPVWSQPDITPVAWGHQDSMYRPLGRGILVNPWFPTQEMMWVPRDFVSWNAPLPQQQQQDPKAGKHGGKSIKRSKSFSQGFLNQTSSNTDTLTRPAKTGTRLSRSSSSAQLSKPQKFNFQGRKNAPMMDKMGSSTNITKIEVSGRKLPSLDQDVKSGKGPRGLSRSNSFLQQLGFNKSGGNGPQLGTGKQQLSKSQLQLSQFDTSVQIPHYPTNLRNGITLPQLSVTRNGHGFDQSATAANHGYERVPGLLSGYEQQFKSSNGYAEINNIHSTSSLNRSNSQLPAPPSSGLVRSNSQLPKVPNVQKKMSFLRRLGSRATKNVFKDNDKRFSIVEEGGRRILVEEGKQGRSLLLEDRARQQHRADIYRRSASAEDAYRKTGSQSELLYKRSDSQSESIYRRSDQSESIYNKRSDSQSESIYKRSDTQSESPYKKVDASVIGSFNGVASTAEGNDMEVRETNGNKR